MRYPFFPTENDLYGGGFDMAAGSAAAIDLDHVKANLLFFDHVVVPDGFLFTFGPLSTQLLNEADRHKNEDRIYGPISSFLHHGLVSISLRDLDSATALWEKAKSTDDGWRGLSPGGFLALPIDYGDRISAAMQRIPAKYSVWPTSPAGEGPNAFGVACKKFIEHPELGPKATLEAVSRVGGDGLAALDFLDDTGAKAFLIEIVNFCLDESGKKDFRRGDVEKKAGALLGWSEFSYDRLWTDRTLQGAAARGFFRGIVSSYQFAHVAAFGASASFSGPRDTAMVLEEGGLSLHREGAISGFSIDLMPRIDVSKLSASDILSVREHTAIDLFGRAKDLRREVASTPTLNNLMTFIEFVNGPYASQILKIRPEAERRNLREAVLGAGNIVAQGWMGLDFVGHALPRVIHFFLGDTPINWLSGDLFKEVMEFLDTGMPFATGWRLNNSRIGDALGFLERNLQLDRQLTAGRGWLTSLDSLDAASRRSGGSPTL